MAVTIPRNSRLQFVDLLSVDDYEFWDLADLPEIPLQDGDFQYTVTSTDRIDTLANRFYGDPVLWWVIAVANGMELLPDDLVPDTVIRIPSPRYVKTQLFQGKF